MAEPTPAAQQVSPVISGSASDRYSIAHRVGSEPFAEVFKAFDTHAGRYVVVRRAQQCLASAKSRKTARQRRDEELGLVQKPVFPRVKNHYFHG